MVPSILQEGQPGYLSLGGDFSRKAWFREVFSFVWGTLFLFYFSFISAWSRLLLPYSLWAFHTSISWWSFNGVWRTASLIKSPGLFSISWSILTIQWFRLLRLVFRFSTFPAPLPSLWGLFQLWSVSPSFSCSITFCFLWLSLCSLPGRQSPLFDRFSFLFFFLDYHLVWSSGRNEGICLYLKILENFMCLILQVAFWFVHILFVNVVKFLFLAQFPLNHLPNPVMSSLVFLLW